MKNRKKDTRWLVGVAMMAAIVVLLANTPLGMIQLPIIKATTTHIPVIIGAILLGPMAGAVLGGVFGLCSLVSNTVAPVAAEIWPVAAWYSVPIFTRAVVKAPAAATPTLNPAERALPMASPVLEAAFWAWPITFWTLGSSVPSSSIVVCTTLFATESPHFFGLGAVFFSQSTTSPYKSSSSSRGSSPASR